MIISITGHTRGIGLSLKEYFESNGHTVFGFSRSTGYNIIKDQDAIVELSSNSDVFINNAYAPTGQTDLLKKIISSWEGTTKTIININSKATLMLTVPNYMKEYVQDKTEQSNIIRQRIFKSRPHIINLITSLVDTDMATSFDSKKINPKDLAKFIGTLLEYKNILAVQEVLIEVTDLDWDNIHLKSNTNK